MSEGMRMSESDHYPFRRDDGAADGSGLGSCGMLIGELAGVSWTAVRSARGIHHMTPRTMITSASNPNPMLADELPLRTGMYGSWGS